MTAQKVRTCCSRSTLTEQGASPQLRACELARSPSTRRASKSPIEEILAQRLVERHTFGEDDMLAVAERFEAGRIAARDAIRRSAPGCAVRATISAMRRSPRCAPKAERPGSWNCRAIAGGNIYGTEKRGGGRPFERVAEPFPWETRWRQGSGLCGLRPRVFWRRGAQPLGGFQAELQCGLRDQERGRSARRDRVLRGAARAAAWLPLEGLVGLQVSGRCVRASCRLMLRMTVPTRHSALAISKPPRRPISACLSR